MDLAALVSGEGAVYVGQAVLNLAAIVGGLKYGLRSLENDVRGVHKRCDRIEGKVDGLTTQGSTQGERIARLEAKGEG